MRIVCPDDAWVVLLSSREKQFSLQLLALHCGYRICEMCAEIGCSQRYLYEVFLRDVGLPPKEWMRQERISVAVMKLGSGWTPAQVAAELGFSSENSFRREFVTLFGIRPREFQRERNQQGNQENNLHM